MVIKAQVLVEFSVICLIIRLINKSTFKIESALNIREQLKYLKRFFPSGFYVISILTTPSVGSKTIKNRKVYYELIKENIIEFTINDGGVTENSVNGWVYCSIDDIHIAFKKAEKKFLQAVLTSWSRWPHPSGNCHSLE